jgi:hypothetical protein
MEKRTKKDQEPNMPCLPKRRAQEWFYLPKRLA